MAKTKKQPQLEPQQEQFFDALSRPAYVKIPKNAEEKLLQKKCLHLKRILFQEEHEREKVKLACEDCGKMRAVTKEQLTAYSDFIRYQHLQKTTHGKRVD